MRKGGKRRVRLTSDVVDAILDDDPHVLVGLVLGDLGGGESLGHFGGGWGL